MENAKKAMRGVWLLICLLFSTFTFAQEIDPEPYRLKPFDVIRLQVYNEAQINQLMPVGPDGNVSAPFVGTVRAAGRTTAEIEAELVDKYRERLGILDPKVSVSIEQFHPIRASVFGMVQQPGLYTEFRPGDTIMTLIARGGGQIPDRADLHRAILKRKSSGEIIPIDLHAMLLRADMTQNYDIEDGDILEIPEATRNQILVLGAIAQPGPYIYREPMYLADAITAARGPVEIRSKMSDILIVRQQSGVPGHYIRLKADFVKFVKGGDNSQNVELKPGDFIYVGETKTPNLNLIGNALNSLFILDRFIRDGFFGLGGLLGR